MKKLFFTCLTIGLLSCLSTTAFASQTMTNGALTFTNVVSTTTMDDGSPMCVCEGTPTITVNQDIDWISFYYRTESGGYKFVDFYTLSSYSDVPEFDLDNLTVQVIDSYASYTYYEFNTLSRSGSLDIDTINYYIPAGGSFTLPSTDQYYCIKIRYESDDDLTSYYVYTTSTTSSTTTTTTTTTTSDTAFSDVSSSAYYADAVTWAVENGVTTGYSDGTFRPSTTCTRGQVVTFLYRAAGEPTVSTTVNPFSDVSSSSPYYTAILWAVENGITTGYSDGTFRPDTTCTNAQVLTFLHRAKGEPDFLFDSDYASGITVEAYANAISWAHENGVLDTVYTGAYYYASRADIVTYLYLAN